MVDGKELVHMAVGDLKDFDDKKKLKTLFAYTCFRLLNKRLFQSLLKQRICWFR